MLEVGVLIVRVVGRVLEVSAPVVCVVGVGAVALEGDELVEVILNLGVEELIEGCCSHVSGSWS